MDQRSGTLAVGAASTEFARLWDCQAVNPDPKEFLADYPNATAREVTDVLLVDQVARWQKRIGRPVDDYLRDFPVVSKDPELFLDLVYGEFRGGLIWGKCLSRIWCLIASPICALL